MEGVIHKVGSVGMRAVVNEVAVKGACAVVVECSRGGGSVGICVLRHSEVVEVFRDCVETAGYLLLVRYVVVKAKCEGWGYEWSLWLESRCRSSCGEA